MRWTRLRRWAITATRPNRRTRCRYLMARQAMDAGEYDEAIALYEACGAYQDAEDGAMQARYARAAALV